MRFFRYLQLLLVCALFSAAPSAKEASLLRIATTTTTDNSGLINELVPAFEQTVSYQTLVIAVGTGKALQLLSNGDVDVALTHAEPLETALIQSGDAINRHEVMCNDFIIVGPHTDPASIHDTHSVYVAFKRLNSRRWTFVSRGDKSGTHIRENSIWERTGIDPQGDWYREAGQGMGQTLHMAAELDAYTLVDRGTWLAYRARLPLAVLYEGDEALFNVYSVLAANPAKHVDLNHRGAAAFTAWLLSTQAANLIRNFARGGQLPFTPMLQSPRE